MNISMFIYLMEANDRPDKFNSTTIYVSISIIFCVQVASPR